MAEMSRLFNFDDFDSQIAEALDENEAAMREFQIPKVAEIRRPGEIGAVALHPTLFEMPPNDAA